MEIKELRVGNWVQLEEPGKSCKIEQHHFLSDEEGYCAFMDHIKPIPLKGNWMNRIGLSGELTTLPVLPERGLCFFRFNESIFLFIDDSEKKSSSALLRIDFVHKAQNLYYELTGNELVINLT